MQPTHPTAADATVPGKTVTLAPQIAKSEPSTWAPSLVGQQLGDHELLAEIARGGMGIVYKARHVPLNRIVALKMILGGQLAGDKERERFRIEAKAAARLQHPHIVALYDVDEFEGQPYFTMEFVPGKSLSQRLAREALPSRLAAHYMEQVARAVHFAHERGIIHRDLKPNNILLDEDDQPKITDFGLAKIFEPAKGGGPARVDELTKTGTIMGTPSYMAPEQAEGRASPGPSCDIYAIGAVLYELLTGRPPFKAESSLETLLQVIHQDPAPPRVLNPNVDADVEAICLKCLEKDPSHRYASAEALADDLARYLQGETVSAASVNVFDRLTRTLAYSQHDKHFRQWGVGLVLFGAIIFAAHAMTTLLLQRQVEEWICFWGPGVVQFVLLALVFIRFRPHTVLPTNPAERLLWAVWGGYIAAVFSLSLVIHALGHPHVSSYPGNAVLTGLAFFVMGAHVWGWCYVIGLAFMLAAPLLVRLEANLAPFWFGVLWGLALIMIGARYWRLGQQTDAERTG